MASKYMVEHLNHLGIVAQVCREIGVAEWLDSQEPTNRQQVSVGTATVALVLNGLGFSNRQLYLVPQFFADKPIEHLLGPGITAADLNDDCLGRTLDWLYEKNVTTLFAGLALRARRAFGVKTERLHGDTTSFSVHGQYAMSTTEMTGVPDAAPETTDEPAMIEVAYGYSRDHREDLKQWMLGIITSSEGIPHFMQPLNGNASDKQSLLRAITTLTSQLQENQESVGVYVADSGVYSTENMTFLNGQEPPIAWVSRVPETTTAAKAMVQEEPPQWRQAEEGTRQWWSRIQELPQGKERWLVVRTKDGEHRARARVQRQAERDLTTWENRMWHLSHETFACQKDAEVAVAKALQRQPAWLQIPTKVVTVAKYAKRGRPAKDDAPTVRVWQIQATVTLNSMILESEAMRRAAFIITTNLVDMEVWPDEAIIALYREQSVVEKGFAFLKDPLFLASSVFVKKPERIMAIAFIMVLCLLVYKLAEFRVRQQLALTGQTVPDQVRKPTARPTMRWIFQCFEGIDLHHTLLPNGSSDTEVLRLSELHCQILRVLGPQYEQIYGVSIERKVR